MFAPVGEVAALEAEALALEALRHRIDARQAQVLAQLDASGVTDTGHGVQTATWLSREAHHSLGWSRRRVRVSRTLVEHFPQFLAALESGEISWEHCTTLVTVANPRIVEDLSDLQDQLLCLARGATHTRFRRDLHAIAALLDTDGPEPRDRFDRNRLHLAATAMGIVLDGELTDEHAVLVQAALESEADRIFHRYRSDHELDPSIEIPARSTLRALALVSLCRKGLAVDESSTIPPRPEVIVVQRADRYETLDGQPVPPPAVDPLTTDPDWRTATVDHDGTVLSLGRSHRHSSPALRKALALRDGGCVFPGCHTPPAWCDAHHVIPWQAGGATEPANLLLLCRHHHQVLHRQRWTTTITPDQRAVFTSPHGTRHHSQRHQRWSRPPPQRE
jgi:hypothetical protein